MTYLSRCGTRSFLDKAANCGEGTPRDCRCGGGVQPESESAAKGPKRIVGPTD